MKNVLWIFAALLLLAGSQPASASSYDACFTWTCDTYTGECSFDASCSGGTPLNYRWTWGDGSPTESIWNDPEADHTYGSSVDTTYVTLSVGYDFVGYFDVTCVVHVRNPVGPPVPTLSGTCD